MPFKLSGLNLNRVDLCPAGANQGADIVLFKSLQKEAHVPAPKKKAAAKTSAKKASGKASAKKADSRSKSRQRGDEEDEESEDEIEKSEDEDDEDVEEDDDEEVEKSDDDEEDEDEDEGDEDDEEEEPARKSKSKSKTSTKKGKKKVVRAVVKDEDDDDLDDDDDDELEDLDEDVLKSLTPRAQKTLRSAHRIAKQALETANIEKDKRVTLEFVEKAKKDIPNLTGTPEEKGDILKALYGSEPIGKKMAGVIVKMLKSADAAVRTMLMSETGTGHRARTDDDESAYAQLEEKRDAILKAEPKLSKQQAMDKAVQQNPGLYNQYQVEKRRARRNADVN